MSTHEAGTDLIADRDSLAAWLEAHGMNGATVDTLIESIERHAAGRLPVFPLQCRAAPDNQLAVDARGLGNLGPCMSAFPTYGNPEAGRIDRMALEIRTT